jgi:transcriptional regulator with XRE-family HTH domain
MESTKEIVQRNCKRLLGKSVNLTELARSMKIDPTTISRWKSGAHSPELDKIDKMAELLDVDALEFFATIERPVKQEPVSKTLHKLMRIPDSVYELAAQLDVHDKEWEDVETAIKIAIEEKLSRLLNKT